MSSTGFIQTIMFELMTNLHGKLVASVAATVDDVEARNWHQHILHLEEKKIKMKKTMKNKKEKEIQTNYGKETEITPARSAM